MTKREADLVRQASAKAGVHFRLIKDRADNYWVELSKSGYPETPRLVDYRRAQATVSQMANFRYDPTKPPQPLPLKERVVGDFRLKFPTPKSRK